MNASGSGEAAEIRRIPVRVIDPPPSNIMRAFCRWNADKKFPVMAAAIGYDVFGRSMRMNRAGEQRWTCFTKHWKIDIALYAEGTRGRLSAWFMDVPVNARTGREKRRAIGTPRSGAPSIVHEYVLRRHGMKDYPPRPRAPIGRPRKDADAGEAGE